MKSLVLFYSETGNTKRIAETIYKALPDEKGLIMIKDFDIKSVGNYDLIFFPIAIQMKPILTRQKNLRLIS